MTDAIRDEEGANLQPAPRDAELPQGSPQGQCLHFGGATPASRIANTRELDNRFSTMTEVRRVLGPYVRGARGNRGGARVSRQRWDTSPRRPAPRRLRLPRDGGAHHGVRPPRRRARAPPAALRRLRALAPERARDPSREPVRPQAGRRGGDESHRRARRHEGSGHAWLAHRSAELQLSRAPAPLRGDDGRPPFGSRAGQAEPINRSKPHPFTNAGNPEFNALVWAPPAGDRGGDVLVADSTIFSTLFSSDESLAHFWKNLATLP